jgi:hypothetical protein
MEALGTPALGAAAPRTAVRRTAVRRTAVRPQVVVRRAMLSQGVLCWSCRPVPPGLVQRLSLLSAVRCSR